MQMLTSVAVNAGTHTYIGFMNAQFFSHLGNNMLLCLHQTLTYAVIFAEKGHMQVSKFVLDCLDYLKV